MNIDVIRLDLRLRRKMILGTGLGAGLYMLLIVAMYPSFRKDNSIDQMISANPAAAALFGITGSITSPDGWLNANMFVNIGPLLTLLLTIGYGAASVAGQNADGTLATVVTLPLGRGRILAQKLIVLAVVSVVVPAATVLATLAGPRFELDPDWTALVQTSLGLALLGFSFGALALVIGTATGSRGFGLGIAAALAAAAYLVSSLAPMVKWVHNIRWGSPFYWAVGDNQLSKGLSAADTALLVGTAVVLAVAAVPLFFRFDVE